MYDYQLNAFYLQERQIMITNQIIEGLMHTNKIDLPLYLIIDKVKFVPFKEDNTKTHT